MSGLETWKMCGWNCLRSRFTRGGSTEPTLYSDRPGIGIPGTETSSPFGSKAGVLVVGE